MDMGKDLTDDGFTIEYKRYLSYPTIMITFQSGREFKIVDIKEFIERTISYLQSQGYNPTARTKGDRNVMPFMYDKYIVSREIKIIING